ncbi:MAG: zinc-binding dehydrogenase [Beutenbergiaceae bacterium]
MRVARLHGPSDIRIEQAPEPQIPSGFTAVRVSDVGLCGSDLHWFVEGGIGDATLIEPLVPGHEFAGIGVGGDLDGVPVAVDPAIPCERCQLCQEGHRNLCVNIRFAGHRTLDGGMAEIIAWPTHLLHPLPEGFTGSDGAMLEPLGVALHAWDLAHSRVGSTVAVIGAGPIGLLIIQIACAAGAGQVVAVEPLAHRREAALRYGADAAYSPEEAGRDRWRSYGLGADVVFEAAGSDEALDTSVWAARPGARVMLVGIPDADRTSFLTHDVRRKGLTLVMVRRMKEMYPRAIRLVQQGHVDVRSMVTQRVGLAQAGAAFEQAVRRQGLKTVVAVDD